MGNRRYRGSPRRRLHDADRGRVAVGLAAGVRHPHPERRRHLQRSRRVGRAGGPGQGLRGVRADAAIPLVHQRRRAAGSHAELGGAPWRHARSGRLRGNGRGLALARSPGKHPQTVAEAGHPDLARHMRVVEHPCGLTERVLIDWREARAGTSEIVRAPQTVCLGGHQRLVWIGWRDGHRSGPVLVGDPRPLTPAVSAAVDAPDLVRRTPPVAEHRGVEGLLVGVVGIDHQIHGPAAHARVAAVGP